MKFSVITLGIFSALIFMNSGAIHASSQSETSVKAGTNANKKSQLEKAFMREFAFLKSQKRILEKRKTQASEFYGQQIKKIKGQIRQLEKNLIAVSAETEELNQNLQMAQRSVESVDDRVNLLENTMTQAQASLKTLGLKDSWTQKEEIANFEKMDRLLRNSLVGLNRANQVMKIKSSYFDENGKEINGEVLRLGRIASFGLASGKTGNLAPAGEGEYKLISQFAVEKELKAETLPIFLYQDGQKAFEEKSEKTILSTIQAGGSIAWVIVFLGLLGLFFIVARYLMLRKASQEEADLVSKVESRLVDDGHESTKEFLAKKTTPTARVLNYCLEKVGFDRESMEDVINESLLQEGQKLDRFSTIILVFAAIAPLLGLLGTVTGMISTFDIITEFGTGDPKLLSSGISEALITTELGLIVAIPTLLLGHLLSAWSKKIKESTEAAALKICQVICR